MQETASELGEQISSTYDALIKRADMLLYQAKRNGRDRVRR